LSFGEGGATRSTLRSMPLPEGVGAPSRFKPEMCKSQNWESAPFYRCQVMLMGSELPNWLLFRTLAAQKTLEFGWPD
jgi:hypothetical protein